MGLFGKPKCPYCGGPLTPTGYSFPFPYWRCKNCIKLNAQDATMKKMQKEIEDLKKQLKEKP